MNAIGPARIDGSGNGPYWFFWRHLNVSSWRQVSIASPSDHRPTSSYHRPSCMAHRLLRCLIRGLFSRFSTQLPFKKWGRLEALTGRRSSRWERLNLWRRERRAKACIRFPSSVNEALQAATDPSVTLQSCQDTSRRTPAPIWETGCEWSEKTHTHTLHKHGTPKTLWRLHLLWTHHWP